jgi:hypothetical protein
MEKTKNRKFLEFRGSNFNLGCIVGTGAAWLNAFDVLLIICKSFWYVFQVAEHKYEDF